MNDQDLTQGTGNDERTADLAACGRDDPDDSGYSLSRWQRTQAAMLYWFMTPDYLAPLAAMLRDLMAGRLDTLLALARTHGIMAQELDAVAASPQVTPAWLRHSPFMFDAVLQRIEEHARATPAARHRGIGLDDQLAELSGNYSDRCPHPYPFWTWASPAECNVIALATRTVSSHVHNVDETLHGASNRWDDAGLTVAYPTFAAAGSPTPALRVRADILAATGQAPPCTGVYVCLDVPHAALQYAWTGGSEGRLLPATTFNDVGLAALEAVGREALWRDNWAMLGFALASPYAPLFRGYLSSGAAPQFHIARYAVWRHAFKSVPGTWALVERTDVRSSAPPPGPGAISADTSAMSRRVGRAGTWPGSTSRTGPPHKRS